MKFEFCESKKHLPKVLISIKSIGNDLTYNNIASLPSLNIDHLKDLDANIILYLYYSRFIGIMKKKIKISQLESINSVYHSNNLNILVNISTMNYSLLKKIINGLIKSISIKYGDYSSLMKHLQLKPNKELYNHHLNQLLVGINSAIILIFGKIKPDKLDKINKLNLKLVKPSKINTIINSTTDTINQELYDKITYKTALGVTLMSHLLSISGIVSKSIGFNIYTSSVVNIDEKKINKFITKMDKINKSNPLDIINMMINQIMTSQQVIHLTKNLPVTIKIW